MTCLQVGTDHETRAGRFRGQGGKAALGFAGMATGLGTGLERLSVLERGEDLDGGLRGQILIVVVVHSQHGGVHTGSSAFDLDQSELSVLGSLTNLDAQILLNRLQNLC